MTLERSGQLTLRYYFEKVNCFKKDAQNLAGIGVEVPEGLTEISGFFLFHATQEIGFYRYIQRDSAQS
jgi:hypothetical protein